MTPRLRAAINKVRGPLKLAWTGPDPHLVGGARVVGENPLDRAPWGVLADRAGELEKPYLEHVLRTLFNAPNPTLGNQTILGGRLHVDPFGISHTAFTSTQWPTVNGTVGGWPIALTEHANGPFRVIIHHPDHATDFTKTQRLATVTVPREVGAGLLHEMEPITGWQYSHGYFDRPLQEAKQRHPNPVDHPEYYRDANAPVQMAQFTGHTQPETDYLERARGDTLKTYEEHAKSTKSASDPFGGVFPKVKTITTLAQLGSPAKGEYEKTYHTVKALFGHDPDGVPAWQSVNGVLSPQTAYLDHAGAASLIVANWLAMGKPKDPDTIRTLISRVHTFGKQFTPELADKTPWSLDPKTGRYSQLETGQTFGGTTAMGTHVNAVVRVLSNIDKLRDALVNPDTEAGRNLSLLSTEEKGRGKVPNFAISYSAPNYGSALDIHMSRLMFAPDLENIQNHSDILSQVKSQLSDPHELTDLERKSLKGYPIKSELVKALMKHSQLRVNTYVAGKVKPMSVSGWLKTFNENLLSKPQYYLAYKNAVVEASRRLGWTPAEVQESVWTGIVALMGAKSVGIPTSKIQEYLTHDAVRSGWQNHEAFVFPGVVDAYRRAGTDPGAVRKLAETTLEAASARSRPGVIPVSDPAYLRRIIAYLPESNPRGRDAAGTIRKALIERLTSEGLWDKTTGKFRLRRKGTPVKLNLIDLEGLHRAIATNPRDSAPWGVMADALEDSGKSALGSLFRMFMNPTDHYGSGFPLVGTTYSNLNYNTLPYSENRPILAGHAGRIPYEIVSHLQSPQMGHTVRILAPGRTHTIGIANVNNLHAQQLAAEMDFVLPRFRGHGERFKQGLGIPDHEPPHIAGQYLHSEAEPFNRPGQPQRLAQYDAQVDFVSALQRAVSAGQKTFVEHLAAVLRQSGITPHDVSPAVHDTQTGARVGVIAAGSVRGGMVDPTTGAAWAGLLGRQPGMLSFMSRPDGPDSVYRFHAQDADKVRQALDQVGVKSRVFAPRDKNFHVFVYDQGRRNREGIAQALTALGTPAEEWRGQGTPLGGQQKDMGREQYRNTINTAEAQQAAQPPLQFASGWSNFRGGAYSTAYPATHPWRVPTHYQAVNDWFEKSKKTHSYIDGAGMTREKHYAQLTPTKSIERDPEDDSLHVKVHSTPVVTIHPDNTYTLRTGQPGQNYGGWRTRETAMTQAYFAPGRTSFRMPGFFNGIRVDQQGRPIHTISGKYNDNLLKLVKEAHLNNTPEARTALNVAVRMLSPSWNPRVVVPPAVHRPNEPAIRSLHDMMVNRGFDPDSPAIPELTEHMGMAEKPYTAHALRILHAQGKPAEDVAFEAGRQPPWMQHLAAGRVAGLPVGLHVPTPLPGHFIDPSWHVIFGLPQYSTSNGYSPIQETKPPLTAAVPQEIGRGVLHEIDNPDRVGIAPSYKAATLRIKALIDAKKRFTSPGLYRH